MLKYRLITGPLLIIALLAIVWLDNRLDAITLDGFWQDFFRGKTHPPRGLLLFVVALGVAPLAARELGAVFRANRIATRTWLTSGAAMVGLILSYSIPEGTSTTTTAALVSSGLILAFVTSLLTFSRNRNVEGVVAAAGAVMFTAVYIGLMLGFLLAIRRWHSAWWIVGIILTTKSCDIGAYFTGTLIGRHKMIPWLSAGKTWEGLAGGVVTAALVGTGMAALSRMYLGEADHVPIWGGTICGIAFAIVGQLGDLTMSLFKRGAGLKDSSKILPGMGGIMDVLDSPLMVSPVAFWLLEAFTRP
ncbi:MAG: phosphatidate cytidylyltransferase [Phycisphaerales bacterium]|nr:phosphatidate cytidylyltransferase [Phycisphaerales bacterium]